MHSIQQELAIMCMSAAGLCCPMTQESHESARLWWQSQLQMPVLKQLARLGASFSRLAASSSRSASEMRLGGGLTERLQTERLSAVSLRLYIDARHGLHPHEGYLSIWPGSELPSPGCWPPPAGLPQERDWDRALHRACKQGRSLRSTGAYHELCKSEAVQDAYRKRANTSSEVHYIVILWQMT